MEVRLNEFYLLTNGIVAFAHTRYYTEGTKTYLLWRDGELMVTSEYTNAISIARVANRKERVDFLSKMMLYI